MRKVGWVVGVILVWMVLVALGSRYVDPDFGWHFRLGEIIFREGFPVTDPFSYAMKSYPFVDYEWGTNLIWYLIYPIIGHLGLVMIYATLAVLSGLVVVPQKIRKYSAAAVCLFWAVCLSMFGARPQVISWLFMALVLRGIWDEEWRNKWSIYFPAIMFLWANLHGSYFLGLLVLGFWLGLRVLFYRKIEINNWILWAVGVGCTIINPYGVRNWIEVVKQISQTGFFSQTIAEWHPFWDRPDLGIMAILSLSIMGIVKFRKKIKIENLLVSGLLVFMGLSHLRHGPFLMLALVPVVSLVFEELAKVAKSFESGEKRMRTFYRIWFGVVTTIFVVNSILSMVHMVRFGLGFYPEKAVSYIKNNSVPQRMFSTYGWGGYLIWKLPGQRVFTDGRMSGFSWKAPEGESDQAFNEYMKIVVNLDELNPFLDKYLINSVLWDKEDSPSSFTGDLKQIMAKFVSVKDNKQETVPERLTKLGWTKVYEDEVAVVFVR